MQESKADIPNYRVATGSKKCGNCGAFENGFCHMFEAQVKPYYTCDEWVTEEEWEQQYASEMYKEVARYLKKESLNNEKIREARRSLFELGNVLEGKKGVHHFLQLEDDFQELRLPLGVHLTPNPDHKKTFRQADLPLGLYIRKSEPQVGPVEKEISLSDDADQEIYLASYPEKEVYKFEGSAEDFAEYFSKTAREENRVHWTLKVVQTAALCGLFFDAQQLFEGLKEALQDDDHHQLGIIYHAAIQEFQDALQQKSDWSYGRVELNRKLNRANLPLSDVYLLLKHASSLSQFSSEKDIRGDLSFVHNSLEEFLQAANLNPQLSMETPLAVDFVVTNMQPQNLIDQVSDIGSVQVDSGVCHFADLPDRQFGLVSYVEGDVEDSIKDAFQAVQQMSDYDEEILEAASDPRVAPDLQESTPAALKEGYWDLVRRGHDFLDHLPDEFLRTIQQIDQQLTLFQQQVLRDLSDVGEMDIEDAQHVANRAEAGDDEKLNDIEGRLNDAIQKVYGLGEKFVVNGIENAGLDRTKIDPENVQRLYNMASFLSNLRQSLTVPEETLEKLQQAKRDLFHCDMSLPVFEVRSDGENRLLNATKEEEHQEVSEVDIDVGFVKILPTVDGTVVVEFSLLSGIEQDSGDFEYSKYYFDGLSFTKQEE